MTQEEISVFKAKQAFEQAKQPIITIDSGLFINALNGFPGIYTGDMFKIFTQDQILKLMEGEANRSAYIQQTLSYTNENQIKSFTSKSTGVIVKANEMKAGYAFDAFFKADSINKLMAEMNEEEKGPFGGKPGMN